MDRNTILRWAFISILAVLFMKWGRPLLFGKHDDTQHLAAETYTNAPGFAGDVFDTPSGAKPPEGELCELTGNRFTAELSSRGAALKHFWLRDAQYAEGTTGYDLSTTPDHERWRSLRTLFRGDGAGADDQVKYDRFNWTLEKQGDTGCKFTYADDTVSIVKTVTVGARPFELNVDTQVKNLSNSAKRHRFTIAAFAFRTNKETAGKLGRVSPFATDLQCARDKEVTRKQKTDFKQGWFDEPLDDRYAAVTNAYFAQALIPAVGMESNATGTAAMKPDCALLAEEVLAPGEDAEGDASGAVYKAELRYGTVSLAPGETADYPLVAYFGPKERNVLANAAGGTPRLGDLINLGFFSPVAKFLVGALVFFHAHIAFGNWGLAIIALTFCLRIGMLPLSIPQMKTTVAMRKLKPEIDSLNKKFKEDAQARQMATMELYRKHGVNPLGGCLPQLVQLPVWWAMWATLQTAVEMYHERFLWLTDLSAPDKYFVLPLVYGVFIVLQQRIVPQQGMDPMQQKMMTYLMPGVFTVMVLFLPAALGLYMLTSSALGIVQQLVMEKIAPRNPPADASSASLPGRGGGSAKAKKGDIVVRQLGKDDAGSQAPAFGKGKARV